ncbi:MAG: hypothetical protein ACO1TE_23030 [Prosthecobacter sp.]
MRLLHLPEEDSDVYGPGTDVMMSMFVGVIMMVALLSSVLKKSSGDNAGLREMVKGLKLEIAAKDAEIKRLTDALVKSEKDLQGLGNKLAKMQERDDILRLDQEGENFSFVPGSFVLTSTQETGVRNFMERLIARAKDFEGTGIDTLEIIGHTDNTYVDHNARLKRLQDLGLKPKNMDEFLIPALVEGRNNWRSATEALDVRSNLDVGFLRAAAVAAFIKKNAPKDLQKLHFRIYSAGPTVLPAKEHNGRNEDKRRRIEFRFTKAKGVGVLDGEFTISK